MTDLLREARQRTLLRSHGNAVGDDAMPSHAYRLAYDCIDSWAEARIKIARMTLTIKLDGNWSSFQLANSAPPLSVTDSAIAPSARMHALSLHVQVHGGRLPLLGD